MAQIGELIAGRYRILSLVGSGWMGTVYQVADEAQDSQVIALKTVRMDCPPAELPESVKHLQREFKILAQLRHPNLVSVYDYGDTAQGDLYFTMEWVQGQSLKPAKSLQPADVTPLMVQACRALAYLHTRGVIHGNLKPSHVLVTPGLDAPNPLVKIVDFGVALEARSPETQASFYTPYYSAPELKGHCPLDPRADLYSLGAIWYALLMGEPPQFLPKPGTERLIALTIQDVLDSQEGVSPQIASVIARLLAISPASRYATANEVIQAINTATGSDYALETRETASSYALRAQFVNRKTEMGMLQALWEQAQRTKGSLALIGGETGVGKTRLVQELEIQAEMAGALVVWGQCIESGGSAYHPWLEVLRVLTHFVESANEAFMQQMGPVLAEVLPELWRREYMARLSPPADLDSTAAQHRLNNAIAQVLQTAAGARPTVIVIENAHWADEASLALLSFLARTPGQAGWMVCVTFRTGEVGPSHPLALLSSAGTPYVELERLSPEVTRDLACSMLGLKEMSAHLAERLQHATAGNALFVQELIRSLAEDGQVLRRTAGGWQVDQAALETAHLPESTRQVLRQRLACLPEDVRQVLSWAAVMGTRFWEDGVAEVGQVARSWARAALRGAVEQALVVERPESAFVHDREYTFAISAVRDASYETIPAQARQDYHGRVAAWLMARSDSQASEHLGLIAEHLEKAGQTGYAAAYLYRAGEQAARHFATAEAIHYFDRALELTPAVALAERYDILLAREKMYDLQGARQAQHQDLAALHELSRQLNDSLRRAQVALRQANYDWTTSDYPASITAAQEAIDLSLAAQSVSIEAAGYLQWAQCLWRLGDLAACRARLDQTLALARLAHAPQWEADSLRILGNVDYYLGHYAQATALWEQALPISCAIGDRPGEASALGNLGEAARSQGDYAGARACYERRLQICRETGERYGESIALINLSLVSHNLGQDQMALDYGQQALHLAQTIGNRTHQGYVWTNMGHALERLGCLPEAAQAYERATALRIELGERHIAMESLAGAARIALAQGEAGQALARVNEILAHLENNTLDGTDEPFKIYHTCYRVLRANRDPRAAVILATTYRLLQEWAAKISQEALRRSFLENVDAHREIVQEFEMSPSR